MAGVYDWSTSASLNTTAGGVFIGPNAPRQNVDDAIRAVMAGVKTKTLEIVSVLDFGATGLGGADDSTAIQAAIDANKGGTIRFPAGYTFLAAGISLSGSSYNGTRLLIEGTFKLKAAAGGANFQGVTWAGIILHDVEDVTVDVPGWMDGNRSAQDASEQRHCLLLAGARNIAIPQFNCKELRGDGIYVNIKTLASPSTNSSNVAIGPVFAINSADDGRNAVSIISGENIYLAGGVSKKVGGVIGASRMPGGFDIEPDDASRHLVKNVRSGPWVIETAGTSGIACIGHAITNDSTRDWNIQDVSIAPSVVTNTAGVGYPIFKRCRRVSADLSCIQTGSRTLGCSIDYTDLGRFRISATGVQAGVQVGNENFVRDSHVEVAIEDHSGAALQVLGADRCRFTGSVAPSAVAGSAFGVQVTPGARSGSLTQTDCVYSVSVPYDANKAFGFLTSSGIALTNCVVRDCAFNGYPNFSTMFGLNVFLPTRNVEGRNFASAVPVTGQWAASDQIDNTGTAAGGSPGWVCTTQGTAGSTAVFKTMAAVAA